MRIVPVLLALAVLGCGDQLTSRSIETPRGTVTYKEQVSSDGFEGTLRAPSAAEAARLKDGAAKASVFIAKYVPSRQQQGDLLENLDRAFAAWLTSQDSSKETAEDVEWVVGAAFGQYCIERLPVRWAIGTDNKGTEVMIVGDQPRMWSYPFAAVRYRIEDRKTDFIGALYEALANTRNKPG